MYSSVHGYYPKQEIHTYNTQKTSDAFPGTQAIQQLSSPNLSTPPEATTGLL
jgi:hypothetical protein